MAECIHGFETELCDICSPRVAPEPTKPVRAPRASKPAVERRPVATPATRTPGSSSRVGEHSAVPFAAQRVYHVTHVRNLEMIILDGEIRAGATPEIDISSAHTRELRTLAAVRPGVSVAEHVPFYLTPNATRWNELRSGAEGVFWSDAAREARPSDFVALVTTMAGIGPDVVVADGDAVSPVTRFATGAEDGRTLLRRARAADPDLLEAEVLAPGSIPFSAVALIGVSNDKIRARVKDLLAEADGHTPRIAVYPPWFLPADQD
ncbi:DarT ssDNA thymidine ADP-ribosyltransferase family protein [Lysobacter korlensis]|uniref:DarT ssDNA thymidine ADP-ribosyltransferase family protein n=1 Tax=Lysobacter korlensis TaxID=553636 RepID=A0ABV6RXJ6_9GAMM